MLVNESAARAGLLGPRRIQAKLVRPSLRLRGPSAVWTLSEAILFT